MTVTLHSFLLSIGCGLVTWSISSVLLATIESAIMRRGMDLAFRHVALGFFIALTVAIGTMWVEGPVRYIPTITA